jgi:hypothetical protein
MIPEDRRLTITCAWNAAVVFFALLYLTGDFSKSGIIAAFVLGSSLLGLGRLWLFRGGFAVALVAIAIALGLPHPEHWPTLVKSSPDALRNAQVFLSSVLH